MFMPHGHCYMWRPDVLWLQVISNGLIGLSYVVIAAALAYLVKKGDYVPLKGTAVAFGVFIVSCGITHFFDVYVIWEPAYFLDGSIRAVTAVASVFTALMMPALVPKALALARGAKVARERGVELEAGLRELGTLYERTRELEQLKTKFFANVSHELRTPLALILGPIKRLRKASNLDEAQRRDLDVVLRSAESLLKHVNDLLEISRLEAGRTRPRYRRVDLAKRVRVAAAHFDALAVELGTDYEVDVVPTLPAEVDPDQVERIAINLIGNAFKFAGRDGAIRVSLSAVGDARARLEVADDGPGIPPEKRKEVFVRFQQLDDGNSREHEGTGLGLAISKDFVELHGGHIEALESAGGGALFRVELPLRAPADAEVEDPPHAVPDEPETARHMLAELRTRTLAVPSAQGLAAPKVLVVEDNADMRRFVADVLAEHYQVTTAENGAEALQRLADDAFDLVVSDLMMPLMSGDRLLAEIRSRLELEAVPVLLLTAKQDDELRVQLLGGGAQDYLVKPFEPDELVVRAANLVTVKRARDVLQRELEVQTHDLEELALQVSSSRRETLVALESMRVARAQAERASQLKSDFLGLLSHELRSPLAGLQMQLERLSTAPDVADNAALVERMRRSSTRMQDLIEGLLEYVRHSADALPTEIADIDVVAIALEVKDELGERARQKGLELRLQSPPEIRIESDRRFVYLILRNLVDNAVKFTAEGSVAIQLESRGQGVRLAVRDTGPGIEAERHMRIFEPFESSENPRSKHVPGLGLGLPLVRELVASLGGAIAVQSTVGHGSAFTVELPGSVPQSALEP